MNAIVVGAGISGLAAAHVLHNAGVSVTVLEASDALGGRVRSLLGADGEHLGDLGPSWVWPPYQPELARWLASLDIPTFAQFEEGDGVIERTAGEPTRRVRLPSQHGQRRPLRGPKAIVDALLARLPDGTVRTATRIASVRESDGRLELIVDDGRCHATEQIVLAAPLRVIARDITFDPPLPLALRSVLADSPTWMTAHAKALIVYDRPFWRQAGLSGRIASGVGPLVEVHDHCGEDGPPAALVGFVGLDAAARATLARAHGPDTLAQAVVEQLTRCLGADAAEPRLVRIEDWAREPFIATAADVENPGGHPAVLPPVVRQSFLGGRLHFAVAESAAVSPGLLEGALVAGERAARAIIDRAAA